MDEEIINNQELENSQEEATTTRKPSAAFLITIAVLVVLTAVSFFIIKKGLFLSQTTVSPEIIDEAGVVDVDTERNSFDPISEEELKAIIDARIAESGDPSIPTKAEEAASKAEIERLRKEFGEGTEIILPTEEELKAIIDARIAESGDPSIPTKAEEAASKAELERIRQEFGEGSETEVKMPTEAELKAIIDARIAESGDPSIPTKAEEAASKAELERIRQELEAGN